MSNVNIRRAVENIRANTTIYTPVIEMIVNAIQAIDETGKKDGRIAIRVQRSNQTQTDGLPEVLSFEIEDNGIGFTDMHRDSFDTLYSDKKINDGGKGFGRFTCLKYFENVHIKSIFQDGDCFKERLFSMGKDKDIIVNEKIEPSERKKSGTVVTLATLKKGKTFEKKLSTIARNLVERLLPYFITQGYTCPEIVLSEMDEKESVRLNDYVNKNTYAEVSEIEIERNKFTLKSLNAEEDFFVRVFKLYSPKNQKSRISLVAHKREVFGSSIHNYIPEFQDEFYENYQDNELISNRNYIIKAYVFGSYLDRNVSLERGGFDFEMEPNLIFGIGQIQIEREASAIAREAIGTDITSRQEKKKERIYSYVDNEAPWHKEILKSIDLSGIPYKPSNEEIEIHLQKEKFAREIKIKNEVAKLLKESDFEKVQDQAVEIVSKISDASKNDLIHYIAHRRNILDIFSKSLQIDENGKYSSEGTVHDIIFPRKGSTEITSFKDHNLWILDERLNFTTYVSSDIPLDGRNTDRPDLIVYNRRVVFRGDNEPSNPIAIFEFKKPQRDDFVNPSSEEDPIQQIVRYVNNIRDEKYKTPEGLEILVSDNTPFYGYVICELNKKVKSWLEREKNFTPMPDRRGWFHWMGNINLYIEVISWDKVLKDATMRNKIFFQKLGII